MSDPLPALEARLRYRFRDRDLLRRALTHSSARSAETPCNERLEFLGDAVLGMVIAHFLFSTFPDQDEGRMTRLRSAIVSTEALARFACQLELSSALVIGRGLSREQLSSTLLAGTVEALFGAIYLDSDLEGVTPVILWGLEEVVEDALARRSANFKSQLQELVQRRFKTTPTYELISSHGPEHQRAFVSAVLVDGSERGRGEGTTKKRAEQAAAQEALERLESDSP